MRRKSYQDEVKESAKGKSTAASSAPKKQRTTGAPTSAATPMPTAHGGKAMEVDARGGASQSSATPFPWPFLRKVRAQVALLQPQRNMTHPQCRLQQLNQTSNKMIRPPCLLRRESRLEPLLSHGHFAMKFSLSYPTFRKNGHSSKST